MDLDYFLISLYVLVEDWWMLDCASQTPKVGRPALLLRDPEVLTLAILAQWPRFRSERNFWRFARSHLRTHFPNLCSQSQFNRRLRALAPELRALQRAFARELAEHSALYSVMDTTLIPAIVRVRASRKGLFCGQASFGRSASKTEWVYGFKVASVVDPEGVVSASVSSCPFSSSARQSGKRMDTTSVPLEYCVGEDGLTTVSYAHLQVTCVFGTTFNPGGGMYSPLAAQPIVKVGGVGFEGASAAVVGPVRGRDQVGRFVIGINASSTGLGGGGGAAKQPQTLVGRVVVGGLVGLL